jgi:hypothetical protein
MNVKICLLVLLIGALLTAVNLSTRPKTEGDPLHKSS